MREEKLYDELEQGLRNIQDYARMKRLQVDNSVLYVLGGYMTLIVGFFANQIALAIIGAVYFFALALIVAFITKHKLETFNQELKFKYKRVK